MRTIFFCCVLVCLDLTVAVIALNAHSFAMDVWVSREPFAYFVNEFNNEKCRAHGKRSSWKWRSPLPVTFYWYLSNRFYLLMSCKGKLLRTFHVIANFIWRKRLMVVRVSVCRIAQFHGVQNSGSQIWALLNFVFLSFLVEHVASRSSTWSCAHANTFYVWIKWMT